jgi:hypothetical protein
MSNFTTLEQPNAALSHFIKSRDKRLRKMRGIGFNWFGIMGVRSTGHVG